MIRCEVCYFAALIQEMKISKFLELSFIRTWMIRGAVEAPEVMQISLTQIE
jgi:hypothetical protein